LYRDNDLVIIIDGDEGSGKSRFAQQIGWYLSDGKLKLENICVHPDVYEQRVFEAKKHDVVIFDEGVLGLDSAGWNNKTNRMLKKVLMTVRSRNLVHIILIPKVFDLIPYVPMNRADCLISVFMYKLMRGFFRFYSKPKCSQLYFKGRKGRNHRVVRHNFYGRFPKKSLVDIEAYESKKEKELKQYFDDLERENVTATNKKYYKALQLLKSETGWTQTEMGRRMGVDQSTISKAVRFKL
jgi:hypothetical protein